MEVDTQTMKSLEALAKTNLMVSEAKNILIKLQETETEYLVSRETKAMAKIQKLLIESQDLIDKTTHNHEQIKQYTRTVSGAVQFLNQLYEKFQELTAKFNERNKTYESNIEKQRELIGNQNQQIKIDKENIKKEYENIEKITKGFEKERIEIMSKQRALETSYEAEKRLWNKLNK